jgi:hypothetical protein
MKLFDKGDARHGKSWTAREIERLIELYEYGCRWGLIARDLGRSVPTCYQRLQAVRYYAKMPRSLWENESETLKGAANLEFKKRS